jgi:serine phosphatase RsbU (regulator of sigma subunit)
VKVVEARRGADPAELSREVMAAVSRFCRGRFRDDASLIVVGVD